MNYLYEGTSTYQEKELFYKFNETIPLSKKVDFITRVTDTIVTKDHYFGAVYPVIFYYYFVKYLTDLTIPGETDEEGAIDLDAVESFLGAVNLMDEDLGSHASGLFAQLKEECDASIDYKMGNPRYRKTDLLMEELIRQQMEVTEQMSILYGGLKPEDIENLCKMGDRIQSMEMGELVKEISEEKTKKRTIAD